MCGIAGILTDRDARENVNAMLDAMRHRGPDDRGTWNDEGVFLGHNRLAIIDLSPGGHQPMVSHSGRFVIVYNGEIYNFRDLRKELSDKGVRFRTESDTEVILALWEREAADCIPKLRGMFAFAVWDTRERTLTLVRDRLGIKPLYYAETPKGFVFASEIKGMLASGLVKRAVNPLAVSVLLQKGHVQQPLTILDGVHALMPGHVLFFRAGGVRTEQYWSLEHTSNGHVSSEKHAVEEVRELIIAAVNEEMVSDRPIGVFLSGGLDSTVMLAALRASGMNRIKTFTIGFGETDSELNEDSDAKQAAAYYETDHHDIQVNIRELHATFDDFVHALDQPSVDGLNTWLVSKATAPHVTVALSGLGGDELFSGYSIDRRILYWQQHRAGLLHALRITKPLWNQAFVPDAFRSRLKGRELYNDFARSYLEWGRVASAQSAAVLAGTDVSVQERAVYDLFRSFDRPHNRKLMQRITAMHIHTFMSSRILRDSDAVAMSNSMEVRFPLIDHRLVALTYNFPQAWHIKSLRKSAKLTHYEKMNSYEGHNVKHLLYSAFVRDLPPGFGRRPKRGFRLPIEKWLKEGWESELRALFHSSNTFLSSTALQSEWAEWKNGTGKWDRLWTIAVLEQWNKMCIAA
jgi:asparagine synthase (glutamine-hydrolysing)